MMEPPPPFDQVLSSQAQPIVLTWTAATDDSLDSNDRETVIPQTLRLPGEDPPEYAVARRPTQPIIYSFSRVSANAMLLLPPPNAPDTRPLYHISVSLNCFNPLSAITCIHRGATENGEFVGDFEMGISSSSATICFRNKEFLMTSLITKMGSRDAALWNWMSNSPNHTVRWDTRTRPAACTSGFPSAPPLAMFYRAEGLRRPSSPAPMSRLEVMPQGHERLDDILISLLIIERKRLTPGNADHKPLFS